ncbi:alpha/beta fold hydrolase [Candidatus Roizmanbacteria bacterium]|nr:alpha/beta fold hydrolase [Candidatus Roizmanbacteria bacterium]
MKYFFVFFFFLFCFLFFLSSVNAQWVKYPQNPVITVVVNTWYSQHVASPTVLYENGVYRMWFQGHNGSTWQIGSAQSNDGIHWDVSSQSQIAASGDGLGVVEPSIIKNGSIYQMWYHEYTQNESRIRYATSLDGISWTIFPQVVLSKVSDGWENTGPTNPAVFFENNEYKMWYAAAGNGSPWKLGYATSPDGTTWTRYQNSPLTIPTLGFIGGPSIMKLDGMYHMWYHTGSGLNSDIYHVISNDGLSWTCDGNCSVLHIGDSYDSQGMTAPFVLKQGLQLYLWYGGSNGTRWQINLATLDLPAEPTPTITPTSTPTASPTLTPTSIPIPMPPPIPEKTPIVIIPGFMSSWNKDAILHNQNVSQYDWKLPSFVKEYDGIINTLKNLNYQENKDFFVFAYDWRKNLESSADDLQLFLQNKILNTQPSTTINIVGHSLGGLVGRIWAQKYDTHNVSKLITVGSPHRGVSQVYTAIEAGEMDKSNSFLWLAEKLILILNKDSFETDKDTINQRLPVLKDIFPTYEFLKKTDGNFASINSMSTKNDLLISYNASEQSFYPVLQTIVGNKTDTTPFGYTIADRTLLDRLLNNYADGRPRQSLYNSGDYLVLTSSAGIGNEIKTLAKDHGEVIYQEEGIKKVFEGLGIAYQDNQIVEGQATKITPSLLFLIKSPAEMTVVDAQGKMYQEENGIIFIENPQDGNYLLQVRGIDQGKYNVIVGEIGSNKDAWNTISGEINTTPPSSQTDSYQIQFNSNPQEFFIDQNNTSVLFKNIISLIKELNNPLRDQLTQAIKDLEKARDYFQNNKSVLGRNKFLTAHRHFFNSRKELTLEQNKKMLAIIDQVENLYQKTLSNYGYSQERIDYFYTESAS